MSYRVVVLFAVVAAVAQCHGQKLRVPLLDGRIVGGSDANIKQYPHQVSLQSWGSHICGGSILNEHAVITAAHCTFGSSSASLSVRVGKTKLGLLPIGNIVAKKVVIHPKYDPNTSDYDVALIILTTSIPFSESAQPIALANEEPVAGIEAVVTGWGTTTEGGKAPKTLQKVAVNIVDRAECKGQYKNFNDITENMICAGVPGGGKDSCQGDSGGPLVANNQLVGIVSWGLGCARDGYPGVYANVANLVSWIQENTP